MIGTGKEQHRFPELRMQLSLHTHNIDSDMFKLSERKSRFNLIIPNSPGTRCQLGIRGLTGEKEYATMTTVKSGQSSHVCLDRRISSVH